ncbi:MAG: hypothetical protein JNM17_02265 [Archangium sp.]|nr:hypothetical protein [Archangium sp.]
MNSLVLLMVAAAADGGMDGGFDGGWRSSDGGLPPPGEYWVLRESRFSGGGTSGYPGRDGGPPESRQTWATRCDRVRLDAKTLEFEGGEVSFVVSRGMIFEPTVRSRYRASARATGHCRTAWPAEPVFDSYEACSLGSPSRVERRCIGKACTWATVAPWRLEPCEDELLRLRGMVGLALEPTHTEALRTLNRLEQVLSKGGSLFVAPGCEPLKITARDGDGMSELDTVNSALHWHARGHVQPLFGEARYAYESGETDGGAGWGSSTATDPILIGRDQVLLGDRLLFFDRQKCRVP